MYFCTLLYCVCEMYLYFSLTLCRGVIGSLSVFHPGGPSSILCRVRNYNWYLGSGTGSTQPREDNWVGDMIISEIWLKKTEIKIEGIALRWPRGLLYCHMAAINSIGLGSPEPSCHSYFFFTLTFFCCFLLDWWTKYRPRNVMCK